MVAGGTSVSGGSEAAKDDQETPRKRVAAIGGWPCVRERKERDEVSVLVVIFFFFSISLAGFLSSKMTFSSPW